MPAYRTRDTPLEVTTDVPPIPLLSIISPTPRAFTFPINHGLTGPSFSPSPSPFEPYLRPLTINWTTPPTRIVNTISRKSSTTEIERRPKKGDEDYIKRPENAFILFRRKCCEGRQQAQDEAADGVIKKQRQADLSKTISQQWKNLSPEDRQYWEGLADAKKKEHRQMYPDYVYRPQRSRDKDGLAKAKKADAESPSFGPPARPRWHVSPFRHGRSASQTIPLPTLDEFRVQELQRELESKKKREKMRKNERKKRQKEAKDEERARRDAEKAAEEAALKEQQNKKQEEERSLREAERKAQEEESLRKSQELEAKQKEKEERKLKKREEERLLREAKRKEQEEERLRKSREREEILRKSMEREAKRREKEEKKHKEEKERLAVQQSFEALNHQDASIRRKGVEAIKELARHKPAGLRSAVNRHISMLLSLLKDSNKGVRLSGIKLLCDLAEHVKICTDAEQAIVGLLDAGDSHLRSSGAYLIAKLVNHVEPHTTVVDSIPSLLRMLGDEDVIVRHASISAIAKLAEHDGVLPSIACSASELFVLLKEGDHRIRHAGTKVLTKIAEHARFHLAILDAIPEVCELLGDMHWWTRSAAAGIIAQLFNNADLHPDIRYRVLHQLFPLLKDRESSARLAAADAFCRWTDDLDVHSTDRWMFIAELLEMLQDSSRSVRFTAVDVITALAKQCSMLHFKFTIALFQLPVILKHPVWGVRRAAICLIEKIVDISTLRPAIAAVTPWLFRLLKVGRTKQSDSLPSSNGPSIVSAPSLPSPIDCTIDGYAPACCAALEIVLKFTQYDDMHSIIRVYVPLLLAPFQSSDLVVQGVCRNAILNLFKHCSLRPALASALVRPLFFQSG